MRARDLMTETVLTVPPNTPVLAVARLLCERHVSAVPVTDGEGRVLGVVSEGDLLAQVMGRHDEVPGLLGRLFGDPDQMAERYLKAHGRTAADIMTTELVSVGPDASVAEVAERLEEAGVRRVLVLRDGKLLGIVSRADLLLAVVTPAPRTDAAQVTDEALYAAIMSELKTQPWASSFYTTINVDDGLVELYGYAGSESYRRALRVLVEGVPGVKAVQDHMVDQARAVF